MLLELSHVCGIAAIAHHPHHQVWYAYLGKYGKEFLSFIGEKK
jgi:hypothetical protein